MSKLDWSTPIKRLNSLLGLSQNWDSYGGRPVDPKSADVARSFLSDLSRMEGIPDPSITVSPDGNISMTWDFNRTTLDVEVQPVGRFHYVYLVGDNEQHDREETAAGHCEIVELLNRFYLTQDGPHNP